MIWDSNITQKDDEIDDFSVDDSIGSENKIKTTGTKMSIMTINDKSKMIASKGNSKNGSKNSSFINAEEEKK